jgi:cellulose synthase/poly-beta-1,6-N-acetylglucosamine synthase-like glycosyltransferase
VLLVRARTFDDVGGFPDMWPGEDLVFSSRIIARGARVAKVNEAVAVHTHPEGFLAYVRHERRLGETAARARLLTLGEGRAFVGRAWLAPVLFCGRALRAFTWVLRHRPGQLGRFVFSLPVLLVGLAAWTRGFVSVERQERAVVNADAAIAPR